MGVGFTACERNYVMSAVEIISNKEMGMSRVAACVPEVHPAGIPANIASIKFQAEQCNAAGVEVAVFPEMCVTGYTCADLFHDSLLLDDALSALADLADFSRNINTVIFIGAPISHNGSLYNCAIAIGDGRILGAVPKCHLPNYNEFYEGRWFASGFDIPDEGVTIEIPGHANGDNPLTFKLSRHLLFDIGNTLYGVELCEDVWVPTPPSGELAQAGSDIILNLSASDALIGKRAYTVDLINGQSARCRCGYVYASAGFGESSTDLAFAGNAFISENGRMLASSLPFTTDAGIYVADIDVQHLRHDRIHCNTFGRRISGEYERVHAAIPTHRQKPLEYRDIDPTPFIDADTSRMHQRCDEISSIQSWGLATRLKAINCRHAVIGISGGLDSTLALLVTVKAFDMLGFDRKGIYAITMPGFGTTSRTKNNADRLMALLGVTSLEIPIAKAVNQHFADIDHDADNHDITYENSQARQRTLILMDYANKVNGLVIGTGDLSELALGWCTYNGDHMSMYGVNASVPKTMVRYLVGGYARNAGESELRDTLEDIIATPISPELLPADANGEIAQKTEDTVGPYELHDFFLYHMMRYGTDPCKTAAMAAKGFAGKYDLPCILHWLRVFYRRFFSQQFKRSCMPDGVKVGSICLSPRGDWRMPSDASADIWLRRIDSAINNTLK